MWKDKYPYIYILYENSDTSHPLPQAQLLPAVSSVWEGGWRGETFSKRCPPSSVYQRLGEPDTPSQFEAAKISVLASTVSSFPSMQA